MSRSLVQLSITEEVGVPRVGEVVVAGVFVPDGRLDRSARLAARAEHGEPGAVQVLQSHVTADGRVDWLAVAVSADCVSSGGGRLDLLALTDEEDVNLAVAEPVLVTAEGAEVAVHWAGHEIRFGPGGQLVRRGAFLPGGATITAELEGQSCQGLVERAEVLQAGPLLAEIVLHGRYVPSATECGAALAGMRVRARITAGAPVVRLAPELIADAAGEWLHLDHWRAEIGTGPVERATVGAFERAASATVPLAIGHDGVGHPRGIFAVTTVSGGSEWRDASEPGYHDRWDWAELHGPVAQNWVVTSGSGGERTLAVERLAEHYPAGVRCEPDGIVVDLYDGTDAGAVLTRGSAPRRCIAITSGEDRAAGARLDHPLVAFQADALNQVRPDVLPYLPGELPNLESTIRAELFGWYLSGQSLGFYDHGDGMQTIPAGPRLGYSSNNEHDAIYALLLHYLRTGERAYLDSAIAYGNHTVDIDLIHSTNHPHELGGLRAHGRSHVNYVEARSDAGLLRTSIDTGHMWVEGLVLLTRVTGEPRYLDAARDVGDCLLRLERLGWTRPEPGPRNAGWPLIALSSLGQATGEQGYLDAAQRIAEASLDRQDPDGRWLMRLGRQQDYCAWQNAVLLVGLSRLATLTGSAELRASIDRGGRAMLDLGRTPEGTFVYLGRYDYRWPQRSGLVREALGCLYEATKDPEYLTAGLAGGARWYPPPGRPRVASEDVAEWRGHLPFLGWAHQAGLLEDLP